MNSDHAPHPGSEQVERFMRGELSRIENLAVVRHLLTRCPQCVTVTRQLWVLRDRPRSLRLVREGAP